MELAQIYRPIAAGLDQVDALIAARTAGSFSSLLKGKRLRPAMVLFASGADGNGPLPDAVLAAATVEVVHTASLIHDDVIDAASRRRSDAALHRLIGVKPAVVLADLLFVQGLSMLEGLEPTALVHPVIREVQTMCEGQWLEMKVGAGRRCTEQQYSEIIAKKTASLFEFCCRAGGMIRARQSAARRRPPRERDAAALADFGREFGILYQLLDDARDAKLDASNAVARAIAEWGGSPYLRRSARRHAASARTAAGQLRDPVARTGLRRLLDFVMRHE